MSFNKSGIGVNSMFVSKTCHFTIPVFNRPFTYFQL